MSSLDIICSKCLVNVKEKLIWRKIIQCITWILAVLDWEHPVPPPPKKKKKKKNKKILKKFNKGSDILTFYQLHRLALLTQKEIVCLGKLSPASYAFAFCCGICRSHNSTCRNDSFNCIDQWCTTLGTCGPPNLWRSKQFFVALKYVGPLANNAKLHSINRLLKLILCCSR